MIGQTISHYHILGPLGEGGMGVVYLAEDTRLGRRVALKIPTSAASGEQRQQYHARFLREARSISVLNHPHIATLFDYGEMPDGRPFIVMELVEGDELGALLHGGGLSVVRAVEIAADVAAALGAAHRRGIVHRDIKPSNIVISPHAGVKVLDFGLAKLIGDDMESAASAFALKTRSDVMLGTPLYLSPEQATGAPVDGRSDLFALGALLYECIAGRPAFTGATVVEIAAQVIHVEPPPPSEFNSRVPAALDRIVLTALAKRPEDRYQTADEMAADLRAVQVELADPGSDFTRTRRLSTAAGTAARARASAFNTLTETLRRPRLSVAALLAGALALACVVFIASRWLRPAPHVPPSEAVSYYDTGVNFLRDGAFYQASKALQQATKIDPRYALAHARLAEAWTELDYADRAKDELLSVDEHAAMSPADALYLEAIRSTVTRDFARAIAAYERIVPLAPDQPQVYVDLGRAYEKAEATDKAIESYQQATVRAANYATAYLRLGMLYGRKSNLASATAAFDKAEDLYRVLANYEGQTETLYQRATMLQKIGRSAEAEAYLRQALETARTTYNDYQQIKILLQLSSVFSALGNITQAQNFAREAIELAQANGNESLTARGLIDLGISFIAGDPAEAEKYFRQALEYARRYHGQRSEARAQLMLGSLRLRQKDADRALGYIEPALAYYQQGGYQKETAQALSLRAGVFRQKGEYETALQAFRQQLEAATQIGDEGLMAASQSSVGSTLLYLENYREALEHFAAAYALNKSLGNQQGIGYALVSRADTLARLGRFKEAAAPLEEVAALVQRANGSYTELGAWVDLCAAQIAFEERRLPAAKAALDRVLLAGGKAKNVVPEAKRLLAEVQALSGDLSAAKRTITEAVELARATGDPGIIAPAQVSCAEVLLASGDARNALEQAQAALDISARGGQAAATWHASMVAARASRRLGDEASAQQHLMRAAESLTRLRQRWGAEDFDSYFARPDLQAYYRESGEPRSTAFNLPH